MAVIKSSSNGTTWTTITVTGTGSTTWATSTVHSLAYANGIWVAGNNANQVAIYNKNSIVNTFNIAQIINSEAITWTTVTSNFGTTNIRSVSYGQGKWLAAGYGLTARYSTDDAASWATTTVDTSYGIVNLLTTSFGVSDSSVSYYLAGAPSRIFPSSDPSSFLTVLLATTPNNVRTIVQAENVLLVGGDSGLLRVTGSLTSVTSNFGTTNINCIAYSGGQYVAVGDTGQIRTSTNRTTWTTVTSNFGTTNILSVAYGNGLWVIGGFNGQMRTSTNGSTWTTVTSNFGTTNINCIAYSDGLWVAGGNAGQVRTSTNGSTWTTVTSNFGTTNIRSVASSPSKFVLVGDGGQIRTSSKSFSTLSLPNTQISSFNGSSFIAISNNRPTSSIDGITWATLSGFESVHVNRFIEQNGKHLLLGNSGVLYEKNTSTTTWTTRSTGIADNFINGAIYNNAGTLSYVLRGNNAMYYSTDLTSWSTVSSPASVVNDIIGKS